MHTPRLTFYSQYIPKKVNASLKCQNTEGEHSESVGNLLNFFNLILCTVLTVSWSYVCAYIYICIWKATAKYNLVQQSIIYVYRGRGVSVLNRRKSLKMHMIVRQTAQPFRRMAITWNSVRAEVFMENSINTVKGWPVHRMIVGSIGLYFDRAKWSWGR